MDIRQSIRNVIPVALQRFLLRGASSFSTHLFFNDLKRADISVNGFLDVGAADGVITELFIKTFGKKCTFHLIEPRVDKAIYLQNKFLAVETLKIHECLITMDGRDVQFALKGNGSSIFDIDGSDQLITCASTRIDRIPGVTNLANFLVKIDVQGAEMEALESLGQEIENVIGFVIECNNSAGNYGGITTASQLISFLDTRGFDLYAPGHLFRNRNEIVFQYDLMFLRKDVLRKMLS